MRVWTRKPPPSLRTPMTSRTKKTFTFCHDNCDEIKLISINVNEVMVRCWKHRRHIVRSSSLHSIKTDRHKWTLMPPCRKTRLKQVIRPFGLMGHEPGTVFQHLLRKSSLSVFKCQLKCACVVIHVPEFGLTVDSFVKHARSSWLSYDVTAIVVIYN